MKLIFSDQPLPMGFSKSIFLAGPSPRNQYQPDWRPEAIEYLKDENYDGVVFIPIPKDKFYGDFKDTDNWSYDNQVEWEINARKLSDLIVFWVDRDIDNGMLGLTTNVEFGNDLHSGKVVYGRPATADKVRYLDKLWQQTDDSHVIYDSLDKMITEVVKELGTGSYRQFGETKVPLFIWNTDQFQKWYTQLKVNGNILSDADLQHHLRFKN